jgi:ribosome-binding protein aMBF1 (putative translation factor)
MKEYDRRLCEICGEKLALVQCDNLLYLCKNCAISAGYNYQVYNLEDKKWETNAPERKPWDTDENRARNALWIANHPPKDDPIKTVLICIGMVIVCVFLVIMLG